MLPEKTDEIPYGTFHTSDLSGLPAYINENRARHSSGANPIPVRVLGDDYNALYTTLKDISDYSYLALDMSGMDGNTLEKYFDGYFASNSGCKIVSVKLSPSITKIAKEAFFGNSDIVSVSMPGVKTIEEDAFSNVYFLREIFMPQTPPKMPENTPFSGILPQDDGFIVYVPFGTDTNENAPEEPNYYNWVEKYLRDDGKNSLKVYFRRYK
jgi:hypothetical protein